MKAGEKGGLLSRKEKERKGRQGEKAGGKERVYLPGKLEAGSPGLDSLTPGVLLELPTGSLN